MTSEALRDRIAKVETRIAKKIKTIESKKALVAKKQQAILKAGYSLDDVESSKSDVTIRNLFWDIEWLEDDLKRLPRELEELQNTLHRYEAQLEGVTAREAAYISEVPDCLKSLEQSLVDEWTQFDISRRDQIREDHKKLTSRELAQKYNMTERRVLQYLTDEDILKVNQKDAKAFVLDLFNRIKDITGEVLDWSGIEVAPGARGSAVLNGVVTGKQGKCRVESIYASGPVQRLHVRVLTKEIN